MAEYYVKNGGNDSAAGTSDGTAWATISKVNTVWAAGTFAPGDNIYFKRGDSFTGTITVAESGSSGNPITIGAYGTGADPVFNGFTTITGWTNEGGGIYSKSVACESNTVVVSLDGVHTAMGRWPNYDTWNMYDSYSGRTQLTDASLNSAVTNWTGAEVVVRINYFIINHKTITSHSGSTINFVATVDDLQPNKGFFIQNDLRTLDVYGEWFYDGSDFYMYFGSEDPDDHVVLIASVDAGIEINGYSYITVENLHLQGFNQYAIYLRNCPHVTVDNCTIEFCYTGIHGASSSGTSAIGCEFTNNTIHDVNCNAIRLYLSNTFSDATISYNTIYNIGLLVGGGDPNSPFTGYGICQGPPPGGTPNAYTLIEYNRLWNIGYIPIRFDMQNVEIRYNSIDGFGLRCNDGGGIYTYSGVGYGNVHHNVVLNAIGYSGGTGDASTSLAGLYSDGYTNDIDWQYNVIGGCNADGSFGYLGNGNDNGNIRYNTFFDCYRCLRLNGATSHDNCNITNNILFARTTTQRSFYYAGSGNLSASCVTDYNYYCRPINNDADNIITYYRTDTEVMYYFTLAEFQSYRGQDAHSDGSPMSVSSDSQIHFIYNDTTVSKFFELSAAMVDITGANRNGTVELAAWESLILLGTGTVTEVGTAVYYISPTGNDSTGDGTIGNPWASWNKIDSITLNPGDTVYIRGGTYRTTGTGATTTHVLWDTITGTADDMINIWAYPGETPILDLDNITQTAASCNILYMRYCNYVHVKGLTITGMAQQPYGVEGTVVMNFRLYQSSHNTIENCTVHHSALWGFSLASGSHYNLFLNCDAHHLTDPYTSYDGSDGFARTGGVDANYNTFQYCRAWCCCDDGWDHFDTDGYTYIDGCWAFFNGWDDVYRSNHLGNGCGFKLGPGHTNQTAVTRVITNCITAGNYYHGVDQNFIEGTGEFATHIYNCLAYDNGGYGIRLCPYGTSDGSNADIIRNNISYSNTSGTFLGDAGDTEDHNSWNGGVTVTVDDFLSLDLSQLYGSRQSDGSLPEITFGHLISGSDLIDAGVDVGLTYDGDGELWEDPPSMGAFEYVSGTQTIWYISTTGNDSTGDGSELDPWRTLAYACSQVTTSGHVIYVKTGTYNETTNKANLAVGVSIVGEGVTNSIITYTYSPSSINDAAIYLNSAQGETSGNQSISYIRIDGNSYTATRAICVNYRSDVSIHHCSITGFNYSGITFDSSNDVYPNPPTSTYATGNEVYDCTFIDSTNRANNSGQIIICGQDGMLVYNNTFDADNRATGSNGNCITTNWNRKLKIYDNDFYRPSDEGSEWNFFFEYWHCQGEDEIYGNTFNGGGVCDFVNIEKGIYNWGIKIYNNEFLISSQITKGYRTIQAIDIEERGGYESVYIYNNYFRNYPNCIQLLATMDATVGVNVYISDIYIYCNIMENVGYSDFASSYGIFVNGEQTYYNGYVDNINIWNNTILNGSGTSNYGITWGVYGETTNVSIRNNIIRGFNTHPIDFHYQLAGGYIDVISVENNLYYDNGTDAADYSGATIYNKTEQNNNVGNPYFLAVDDFHLTANSVLAIEEGISVGLSTDYDNISYSSPPSIGAYEFVEEGELQVLMGGDFKVSII